MASTEPYKTASNASVKPSDVGPQNALQSDFNAGDDTSSMDSDERYLVRLSRS